MTLQEIKTLLEADVICGYERLNQTVRYAFAADLMSDVLRLNSDEMLLITGLVNLQAVRTAEMSDIGCILFVRGKPITPEMIRVARENNMVLLQCEESMFKVCGELYRAGMEAIY